jgi:hypothetical protein
MPYFPGLGPITLDKSNNRVGINKAAPVVDLDVVGRLFVTSGTFPPLFVERTTATTNGLASGMEFRATSSGNMADGFGTQILFSLMDDAQTPNTVAGLRFTRDGADNLAALSLLAGNLSVMMTIKATGRIGLTGITAPTAWMHLPASTTVAASLCVPHGTAPTSPVNGDIWTDASGMYVRLNGVTRTITVT